MRDTFQIVDLLSVVDQDEVVWARFSGMNPQLEEAPPAELIAEVRVRDAMTAARAFVNDG